MKQKLEKFTTETIIRFIWYVLIAVTKSRYSTTSTPQSYASNEHWVNRAVKHDRRIKVAIVFCFEKFVCLIAK